MAIHSCGGVGGEGGVGAVCQFAELACSLLVDIDSAGRLYHDVYGASTVREIVIKDHALEEQQRAEASFDLNRSSVSRRGVSSGWSVIRTTAVDVDVPVQWCSLSGDAECSEHERGH